MKEQTQTRAAAKPLAGDKPPLLQRKCGCGDKCSDCEKKKDEKKNVLQRFGGERTPTTNMPPSVDGVLRSPGRPLDAATRARFEPRFGFDFSSVRVHADDHAHDSAREVGAIAYTVGHDVAFSSGQYRPGTSSGDALLAHELAHVVQQRGAGTTSSSNAALEADADRSADLLTRHRDETATPLLRAAPRLSMQPQTGGEKKKKDPPKKRGDNSKKPPAHTKATAGPPPPKTVPSHAPPFEIAGKTKTRWRVSFKTKKEAENQRDHVKALRVKVEEAAEVDGLWTFDYYPLTEAEANAEQATKEKALPKYDVTVQEDTGARTFFLQVLRKCPKGLDGKSGFTVWDVCFAKEADAKALVKKFNDVHVDAETAQAEETRWGVYYKPLDATAAKAAGETAAKARGGSETGIYKVDTEEKKDLKTFTYSMKAECPPGHVDMGSDWYITAYFLANEKDYAADEMVEAPGIPKKKFRKAFLYDGGVRMQGTGRALDGKLIAYQAKTNTFKYDVPKVETASTTEATVGRTVAIDPTVPGFKYGTELIIEDVGHRVAEDTGGRIKGHHIDVYFGETKTKAQAWDFSLDNRKVCRKTAAKP